MLSKKIYNLIDYAIISTIYNIDIIGIIIRIFWINQFFIFKGIFYWWNFRRHHKRAKTLSLLVHIEIQWNCWLVFHQIIFFIFKSLLISFGLKKSLICNSFSWIILIYTLYAFFSSALITCHSICSSLRY